MNLTPIYNIDEICDETQSLVVHFNYDYADEFDINNYVIMTKKEYLNYLSLCQKYLEDNKYLEVYFGTNEFISFYHLSNFKAYRFYIINLNHIEIIKPYFELIANINIIERILERIEN